MKADHNTIKPFGIKVMSKYKVLSKREHGMIKTLITQFTYDTLRVYLLLWQNRHLHVHKYCHFALIPRP